MQTIKNIGSALWELVQLALAWLIKSSKEPQAVALTIKATLTAALTYATVLAGLGHVQLPNADITSLIDLIVQSTQTFLLFVSTAYAAIGIIRKIWRTIQGTHVGLNSFTQGQ